MTLTHYYTLDHELSPGIFLSGEVECTIDGRPGDWDAEPNVSNYFPLYRWLCQTINGDAEWAKEVEQLFKDTPDEDA